MRFSWQTFCEARGIRFEAAGPRVSKGNINVHCPFCGAADKSGHMGLSLDQRQPFWGCLRNSAHRGRDPARLVSKLLRVNYNIALAIVEATSTPLDEFESAVDALREQPEDNYERRPMRKPEFELGKEVRMLRDISPRYLERFYQYLASRNFYYRQVMDVVQAYELYGALTGPFAWRLVFPVRDAAGALQGATGRALGKAELRYLTSDDLPADALLDFLPEPGALMLVCEGPMDALKLDYFGRPYGIRGVATMGTGQASADKAAALRSRYKNLAVVFDADAHGPGMRFAEELRCPAYFLPPGVEDPGKLSPVQAVKFIEKISANGLTQIRSPV